MRLLWLIIAHIVAALFALVLLGAFGLILVAVISEHLEGAKELGIILLVVAILVLIAMSCSTVWEYWMMYRTRRRGR